jgi:hypothetical protein
MVLLKLQLNLHFAEIRAMSSSYLKGQSIFATVVPTSAILPHINRLRKRGLKIVLADLQNRTSALPQLGQAVWRHGPDA